MANPVTLEPLAPQEAITFFRSKGYANALSRFDYRDVWQEEHARQFVVAKAMQDDVLVAIRNAIEDALVDGTTYQQFRDRLKPELQQLGWWGKGIQEDPLTGELKEVQLGSMHRLRTIFHTNVQTAYAAGRWARLSRGTLMRFLEYRQIDRPTARDEHKPFDGLILPIEHPIWRKIFPPNGWFCGCDVRPMTQGMIDREGKRVTTEDELAALQTVEWRNPRTGQVDNLIEGIDPAFASNPGHAWLETDDRHAATAAAVPAAHRAYDRGYLKELAGLALRDRASNALLYDRNGDPAATPLGIARQIEDENERPQMSDEAEAAMQDAQVDGALLQGFPEMPIISAADVMELSGPGLNQLAAIGADGTLLRMTRIAETSEFGVSSLLQLSRIIQNRIRDAAVAGDLLTRDVIASNILARHLARIGLVQFDEAPSGRVADILADAAPLIDDILASLMRS